MNTVGIDPHKHVHHAAILDSRGATVTTAPFRNHEDGQRELIAWAREHGDVTTWAIEGTGGFGRNLAKLLVNDGADVREAPPNLTARERPHGQGKSDRIDAIAIAQLAQRRRLPVAFKQGSPTAGPDPLRDQLVLLHRARRSLVKTRVQLLTEAEPLLNALPSRLARQLPDSRSIQARLKHIHTLSAAVVDEDPVARLQLRMLRDTVADLARLATREQQLLGELADLLTRQRSTLPDMVGLSIVSAVELLAEVGDVRRFTIGGFARYNGTAPVPASSAERDGQPVRYRLSRSGNRKLNALLHRMAMIQLRCHAPAREVFDAAVRRGHTRKEAMRILKRNLSNSVYRRMLRDANALPT